MESVMDYVIAYGIQFLNAFIPTTCAVFVGTIVAMNYLNGKDKK